jgi:ketosteroid isomerase-like protein
MTHANEESTNLAQARAYLVAVERGANAAEIDRFLHTEVVAEVFPNRITPRGRRYSRDDMLRGPALGKKLLPDQHYEITSAIATGDRVIVEALWTGTLAIAFGEMAVGTPLRAHIAMILEFRDGLLIAQRNYDCYEPIEGA